MACRGCFPSRDKGDSHVALEMVAFLVFFCQNVLVTSEKMASSMLRGGGNQKQHFFQPITRALQEDEADGAGENVIDQVGDEFNQVLNSSPNEWSTAQLVGVAVGSLVLTILLVLIMCCCRRYFHRRAAQAEERQPGGAPTYHMKRPYVIVTQKSVARVDALEVSTLPLSVRLHGAVELRKANLLGQNVRIGVIDSGIDRDHPGFHGKVKRQVWYRKGTPLSKDDHGTHVAGTIHFMAPRAELFDYRVFGAQGDLDGDNAIAAAIREAVDVDKCHVINMSLRVSYPIVPAVRAAVEYAYKKGVHMVCAAGNSGDGDPTTNEIYSYPARWKETISVAAVKKAGGLPVAYFSESNPEVDFAAIGVDVISMKPGGGYQGMQGTSMASPHVAGLIAALLSNNGKKYTPAALKQMLARNYAIDIGAKGPDTSTGVGFLTYLSSKEELVRLLSGMQQPQRSASSKRSSGGIRAQAY
jgi:subtilisin family serine protease